MKNFFLSLLLLCSTLTYGQNSWFNLDVQFDQYGPSESFTLFTQAGDTLVNYTPTVPNELYQTLILADSGAVDISLYDSFGDGWGPTQPGQAVANITMSNACQGIILDLDADFAFTQFDTTVNLLPCPPPVSGCMDPNSASYDPLATVNNPAMCTYAVEFSLNMNNYSGTFTTPGVTGEFDNWSGNIPMLDPDGDNIWTQTVYTSPGVYKWKFILDNFAQQELPQNVQNDPLTNCFVLDQYGFTNRTLDVTTDSLQTLPTYCWESCYDCGTILGCTDSTSNLYNPWATDDDGSCSVSGPSGCDYDQTYIELVFTPDNWPSETSIIVYDDNGAVFTAPQGTYSGQPGGVPISEFICVDSNVLIDFVIEDSYGDGLGGSATGGVVDGNLEIFDCDGIELFDLVDSVGANFGYQYTSPQFSTGDICTTSGPTDILGCMDPFSITYDSSATIDDGSCGPARVLGCTDPTAFNYDPNADQTEVMTGDYTLEIFDGASDGWSGTWLGLKQGDWLSPQFKMGPNDGNSLTFQVPLNIFQNVEAYLFTTSQSQNTINQIGYTLTGPEGDTIINVAYWDAIPFPFIVEANALPTFGDVCIPVILGCMDSTAFNYIQPTGDPLIDVNTDDGSCIPVVEGCTNPLAFNYDPAANVDDGSCVAIVQGCMDPNAYNYNPNANVDDGSCIYLGCTDSTACNFDSNANVDNGGCTFPAQYYDCYGACINDTDGDGVCDELEILGCTDPLSINFNPQATDDDGSCIPIIYGCTDSTAYNYNPQANTDDGSCIAVILGCTDPTAFNYDPNANTDDGTCIPVIFGCTDPTSFNYDPNANTDNGSCIPVILGCTDTSAFNYNPLANTDDGTCYGEILGCTNPLAYNYNDYDGDGVGNILSGNPQLDVNTDDGSCVFDAGCITGPGNPYWLNDQCYAWVIDVDSYCCENEWDAICQEMYNYCENGWPDGMDIWETKRLTTQIAVYPNPVKNILNIATELDIAYSVYDLTGKVIILNSKTKQVDLTGVSNGIYLLEIDYEGTKYRNKIIKE